MTKPFFSTRQTTTLLEEFTRELIAQAGLFLIDGDEGVGKTRLLAELAATRLADRKFRWMDLQAGDSGEGVLVDSSVLIEKTFARARSGDVIVADHFEMALKKTRHQLFLSWSTDGLDKNLRLIIAASSDFSSELRQLAQQYQVSAQSFQQLSFSAEEAAAFLGFYLFPDRPAGELVIPSLLRDQLAMAEGNVGKLIEIAERAGDQISSVPVGSRPVTDSKSIRPDRRKSVGAVSVAVLLLGVSWHYLGNRESGPVASPEPATQVRVGSDSLSVQQAPDSMSIDTAADETVEADAAAAELARSEVVEPAARDANDTVANEAVDSIPAVALTGSAGTDAAVDGQVVIDEAPAEAVDAVLVVVDPLVQPDQQPVDLPADSSSNAEIVEAVAETVSTGSEPTALAAWSSARLRRDLQASLEWISAREPGIGTLQIMLLSQARFDEQVYYEHLAQLASQGVDVSTIRIFESYSGNQAVLSVVYGEYPSRTAANDAKPDLAPALRKTGPVARSVGSLLSEIQRLREQN